MVRVAVATCLSRLLFLLLDHEGFGGQQHRRDGRSVLQSRPRDLDRVNDAGSNEIDVLAGGCIEALTCRKLGNLGDHDIALLTCVLGDPAQRLNSRATNDADAGCLIASETEVVLENNDSLHECAATAGDDALFDCGARRGDGVLNTVLLLLELNLGVCANLDDDNATAELGQALGELLAIPIGIGALDLALELGHAVCDSHHRRRSWCCPW